MPRRKKEEIVEEPTESNVVEEILVDSTETSVFTEEEAVEIKEIVEVIPKKPSDIVKVQVKVGSLHWEGGWFNKGDIFECSRKRAQQFEFNDAEIVE